MKIINQSNYPSKEVRRLVGIVRKRMKKSFTMPEIETIVAASPNSKSWHGGYDGKTRITVSIGRKVPFPNKWDGLTELVTWEDLFVGLLTWCYLLHFQRTSWIKKTQGTSKVKYSRVDCQEITVRTIQRWRVDSELKLIFEKAGMKL